MNLSLSLLLLQMLHSDIISQPNLPECPSQGWTNITIDSKRILLSTILQKLSAILALKKQMQAKV